MSAPPSIDKKQVADFYRQMLLIRRFEEASGRFYMQGKIKGFIHLYIGQEAVAVGAISALDPEDYVISHHRDHGHALAKGLDPKMAMAELFGKATGASGGRGGSMHLFDLEHNFMGGYAIVAGQIPIAVGLALACQMRGDDRVVMCFFGDGAVNQGEFHESLNLASLWKLPVLFFLENNMYGMGTRVDQAHAGGKDIYLAAETYKIPAAQIDGMDVLAVHEATTEALRRVRSKNGPVFLEAITYRFRGHSASDPSQYRESSEVDEWRSKDPIEQLKSLSSQAGLLTDEEMQDIEREVEAEIAEAVQFAEDSPEPAPSSLHDDVYA
ncbi:MAG: pyruvate dehydrogenase (acetyl-transferring) E1 component subunit alpha [Chloroflexi bacterium]|nr:pyruvate dehydrogenase (acetyl-transferring) E1 component subunit alpha [Chloroflexota bacterium]